MENWSQFIEKLAGPILFEEPSSIGLHQQRREEPSDTQEPLGRKEKNIIDNVKIFNQCQNRSCTIHITYAAWSPTNGGYVCGIYKKGKPF